MRTSTSCDEGLWQPVLVGNRITAAPLLESDFFSLFEAASDPKIWEQNPVPNRHTKAEFDVYFRTGMDSKGALLVKDKTTDEVIGTSRFVFHDSVQKTVEIGWTFLRRSHWGNGTNNELKMLMLQYAFKHVDRVEFFVGTQNFRSQAAVLRLGAKHIRNVTRFERPSLVYEITAGLLGLKDFGSANSEAQ